VCRPISVSRPDTLGKAGKTGFSGSLRVPDTYQLFATRDKTANRANRKMNKLRRLNTARAFESHSLRHEPRASPRYTDAEQGVVRTRDDPDWMPDKAQKAIQATGGGKIKEILVNSYWRDFQCGLTKAADEYPNVFGVAVLCPALQ
jgi:hypothetical protein